MRHLILEEPVSRPAKWSPRIAWFAIAVTVLSAILIRLRLIAYEPGFIAMGIGLGLGILAILLALISFIRIWQEGRRGFASAVRGILLSVILLVYPGWFALKAATLPPINDVTTDTENPPAFSRSGTALAARDSYVPAEPDPNTRTAQHEAGRAYEQIAPIFLDMESDEAFALAGKAARNLGWQVIEEVPGGRIGAAHIDAVAYSRLLRLPYDVTIRVRPRTDGARIDIRSASRIGRLDSGANAGLIRNFLDEVSNLAIAEK